MRLPEWLSSIIEEATDRHRENIDDATKEAETRAKSDKRFKEVVDTLVRQAIREAILDQRHKVVLEVKRELGYYSNTHRAKVNRVASKDLNTANLISMYQVPFMGTTLGAITGYDLDGVIRGEREKAAGHEFNASMAEWLKSRGVIGPRSVEDVVKENDLRVNYMRILGEVSGRAG